jgi:PPOX class probable F420-dependent enzyme
MTPTELDSFLEDERTCRVATLGADGSPHVSPLWFVWDGSSLWLNTLVKSQRWTNLVRDPRVSVAIDAGPEFSELRGVIIEGRAQPTGDAPRTSAPDPTVADAERRFADKYQRGGTFTPDGNHAWVRVVPNKLSSWDFRKMTGA